MSEQQSPDFDSIDDALQRVGAPMGAAESHGLLCGMICGQGHGNRRGWGEQVLDEVDMNNLLVKECDGLLDQLFEQTQQQLNDAVLEFALFLPVEGDVISIRVEALAEWCQGFLYGFGIAGGNKAESMPDDSRDLLRDIAEISRAAIDDEDDPEVDESAYTELVEYLRMGVLLMNEELHPIKAPARLQ